MTLSDIYFQYIIGKHITIDSRKIQKGDVYVALKGANFDGNEFAQKAIENGAETAIIDNPKYQGIKGCVLVDDTLAFLQNVANFHRRQLNIPIIGITGTNGKTTTKELCNAVLSKKYKTFATIGNLNNHIGVPLTLLSMSKETQIGIVEMGANHPNEIKMLCEIADPDFGIITNIGHAHIEGFGCYENIIQTKKQLYDYIKNKQGKLFVNANDALLMELSDSIQRFTYGKEGSLIKGEVKQSIPSLVFALKSIQGDLYIKTRLIGGYNFDNAMAAACVGKYYEINNLEIRDAIEAYQPSNMRSQLIKTERNTLILDAYNANPSSMSAAIKNFIDFHADNKVLVLGEMRELGQDSEKSHAEIIALTQQGHFSNILLVGQEFAKYQGDIRICFENTETLKSYLKEHAIKDACILIKGSRGNQLEQIVDLL